MNSEQIILTDHDSVSGQLVAGPVAQSANALEAYWAWGVLGVCLLGAVVLGVYGAPNPVDQWAAVLVWMPVCLVGLDVFLMGLLLFKQIGIRALGLPAIGSVFHLLTWMWAQYLASFEVFYGLDMQSEFHGVYEVRLGIAFLLGGLGLLAVAAAVYEVGVVGQLVGDLDIPIAGEVQTEEDTELASDHIFDAQVLLNNLGYDVGGIDGVLGPKTETALKQFQSVVGLAPQGRVTARTLGLLRQRGQAHERLSLIQTFFTFVQYWSKRLADFLRHFWTVVIDR
ncbi:MAG: peptidoglycan-binding domain-containing protein [Candidatus Latescibacterota bacterium]